MTKSKFVNKGFTLVELLVVIAITSILLAIAYPAMNRTFASQKLNSRSQQLQALLQFARSEAVRTNKPVLICPTKIRKEVATSNSCLKFSDYNDGLGWQGFMAFSDDNLDGSYKSDIDKLVRVVAINQNIDSQNDISKASIKIKTAISCSEKNKKFCNSKLDGEKLLGFMPDGRFGIGYGSSLKTVGRNGSWDIAQSHFIFELKDRKYEETIKSRFIITPGGSVIECNVQNIDKVDLCKLELK